MAHYLDSTGLTTLWAKIKALIPTSLKNPNALTIQLNGTSQGAYDGSSAKTVNVTKSSIGLGNVDNTADANKSVASATKVVASVTGTNSAELVRGNMADNDQFRILVGGTASNAGYAELATADDGSEPIYVRQYTGVFTNLARTATLLDGSGNTSFPGTVSASSFSGNLSGNATTATTATTAYSAQNAVTASTATSASLITKNSTFNDSNAGRLSYYDGDINNTENIASWSAPSKGWHQIIHNDLSVGGYWTELSFPVNDVNGLAWRQRRADNYYGWYRILDSNNYNNYVPSKTGSGASGTWAINISGSAAKAATATSATSASSAATADKANTAVYATSAGSATSATSATTATVAKDNGPHAETASGTTGNKPTAGMLYDSGMYMTRTYSDSAAPVSYGNIINVAGSGTGQLLLGWAGNDNTIGDIWYRSHRDTNSGGWSAWKRLAYATEIPSVPTSLKNPYAFTFKINGSPWSVYDGSAAKEINISPSNIGAATASHTHSYLPLSGGTVTGDVTFNGDIEGYGSVYFDNGLRAGATITCDDDLEVGTLLTVGGNVAIGAKIDTDYALEVGGASHFGDDVSFGGIVDAPYVNSTSICVLGTVATNTLKVEGNTTLSQSCTFSKSEAHFGVNGSYTDPYNGQAAGFKFGGSIAATYGYFYNDIKAKNIIVNGGNVSFIVNGTTYKLNMSRALELGLVTT